MDFCGSSVYQWSQEGEGLGNRVSSDEQIGNDLGDHFGGQLVYLFLKFLSIHSFIYSLVILVAVPLSSQSYPHITPSFMSLLFSENGESPLPSWVLPWHIMSLQDWEHPLPLRPDKAAQSGNKIHWQAVPDFVASGVSLYSWSQLGEEEKHKGVVGTETFPSYQLD